jgi:ribose transport system substrate-binding protein
MKTYIRCSLIILLSVVSASAVPKIGVLLKDRGDFCAAVERGIVDAGQAHSTEILIKAPPSINSLAEQLKLFASLEKDKIDALIISPQVGEAFKVPLERLTAHGVKVVCLETAVEGVGATLLGYDQKAMAEAAAQKLVGLIQDGDEIALLRANNAAGMSVREKTLIAFLRQTRPANKLNLDVMTGAEKGDDLAQARVLLDRHPQVKVVITPYSEPSLAMVQALQEKKLAGKVVHIGFGAGLPKSVVQALEGGAMQLWVAQLPRVMGRKSIETALALTNGEIVPASIAIDYFIITKANLYDAAIQAAVKTD